MNWSEASRLSRCSGRVEALWLEVGRKQGKERSIYAISFRIQEVAKMVTIAAIRHFLLMNCLQHFACPPPASRFNLRISAILYQSYHDEFSDTTGLKKVVRGAPVRAWEAIA